MNGHCEFMKKKQFYTVNAGIIPQNSDHPKIKKIYRKLQTLFKDSMLIESLSKVNKCSINKSSKSFVGKIWEVESDFKFVYFLYSPCIVMHKFRELCHIYSIFSKVTYLPSSHRNSNHLKIKKKTFSYEKLQTMFKDTMPTTNLGSVV